MFLVYHIEPWSGEWDFTRADSAAWPRPLLSDKTVTPGQSTGERIGSAQYDYG